PSSSGCRPVSSSATSRQAPRYWSSSDRSAVSMSATQSASATARQPTSSTGSSKPPSLTCLPASPPSRPTTFWSDPEAPSMPASRSASYSGVLPAPPTCCRSPYTTLFRSPSSSGCRPVSSSATSRQAPRYWSSSDRSAVSMSATQSASATARQP